MNKIKLKNKSTIAFELGSRSGYGINTALYISDSLNNTKQMKNTKENKEKFFAQYWGQDVKCSDLWNAKNIKILGGCVDSEYLLLTPLSQITDEDAIEVGYDSREEFLDHLNGFMSSNHDELYSWQADILRSKGYALPFNGTTIEELIQWGWVKLKTV